MRALVLALTASAAAGLAFGPVQAAPAAGAAAKPAAADAAKAATVIYSQDSSKSLFAFDYGPPTSPAMTLLGLTPDGTPPSTSLTKFVLAAPALFGGNAGQSLAFDFAPSAVFERPEDSNFTNYVDGGWLHRLGYRTRVSIAALNGSSGGGDASKAVSSGVALGFSASLLDLSDPLMTGRDSSGRSELVRCLVAVSTRAEPILHPGDRPVGADAAIQQEIQDLKAAGIWARTWKPGEPVPQAYRDAARPYIPGAVAGAAPPPPPPTAPSKTDLALANARAKLEALKAVIRRDPGTSSAVADSIVEAITATQDAVAAAAGVQPPKPAAGPPPAQLSDAEFVQKLKDELASAEAESRKAANATSTAIRASLDKAGVIAELGRCTDRSSRLARFSPDLDVGGGMIFKGAPGQLRDLTPKGQVLWTAFKTPLSPALFKTAVWGQDIDQLPTNALMLYGSGRFGWNESVSTGDKTRPLMQADTINAWVGLEWLAPTYRLAGQYGWTDIKARTPAASVFDKSGRRYLISGQVQLGDETSPLWLGVSYGNGYGTTGDLKGHTALVTLSYTPPKPLALAAGK